MGIFKIPSKIQKCKNFRRLTTSLKVFLTTLETSFTCRHVSRVRAKQHLAAPQNGLQADEERLHPRLLLVLVLRASLNRVATPLEKQWEQPSGHHSADQEAES